jgi:hypothetical protein
VRKRLTFKSIETILAEVEASGELKRFVPAFDEDECEKRCLYIATDLHDRLYDHPGNQRDYFDNVRAILKSYVIGDEIDDDDEFFKRLKPKRNPALTDIWEIKITFAPTARIFGCFAAFDLFFAYTSRLRERCPFEAAMQAVHDEWHRRAELRLRYRGWPLDQCISNCGVRTI